MSSFSPEAAVFNILPVFHVRSKRLPRLCCNNCTIQIKAGNLPIIQQLADNLILCKIHYDCTLMVLMYKRCSLKNSFSFLA